jgi:hypothetical protein
MSEQIIPWFKAYLRRHAERFAGQAFDWDSIDDNQVVFIVKQLEKSLHDNVRSQYVLYYMWAYSLTFYRYYATHKKELLLKGLKLCLIMKSDEFRFNNFQTLQLIAELEQQATCRQEIFEELPFIPVEADFEDAMQFIYTCVKQYKQMKHRPLALA